AVVAILEVGREGELRGARLAAAVDRIGAIFDYISNIPEEQRESAVHALSGNFYHYSVSDTPQIENLTPSDEERRIASVLVAGETNRRLSLPRVQLTEPVGPALNEGPSVEITQEMDTGEWLWARFDRPPPPSPAPDLLIAAALGTLLTGLAAAWLAGRVSRPL